MNYLIVYYYFFLILLCTWAVSSKAKKRLMIQRWHTSPSCSSWFEWTAKKFLSANSLSKGVPVAASSLSLFFLSRGRRLAYFRCVKFVSQFFATSSFVKATNNLCSVTTFQKRFVEKIECIMFTFEINNHEYWEIYMSMVSTLTLPRLATSLERFSHRGNSLRDDMSMNWANRVRTSCLWPKESPSYLVIEIKLWEVGFLLCGNRVITILTDALRSHIS
jgi:hypothetical protein